MTIAKGLGGGYEPIGAVLLGRHIYDSFANGSGFSPASYSRSDRHPDPERDSALLEDAYASIAAALARDSPNT